MLTPEQEVFGIRSMIVGVGLSMIIHFMMLVISTAPTNPLGAFPFWTVFVGDLVAIGLIGVAGIFMVGK